MSDDSTKQSPSKKSADEQNDASGATTARLDPEKKYEKFANACGLSVRVDIKQKLARNNLRTMLCKKDHEMLGKSFERFKAEAGDPKDKSKLTSKAEEELRYLELRDELLAAMDNQDLDKLLEFLERIEKPEFRRFRSSLTPDIMQARKLICSLNRKVHLPKELDFDDGTMRELAQFSQPPKTVHDVVIASLLLLGEYEGFARNWGYCRDLLKPYKSVVVNRKKVPETDADKHEAKKEVKKEEIRGPKGGLRYRVENFDPAQVNEEFAGRAKEIMDAYKIIDVFRVSESAAGLYVWARSKLEEVKVGAPADLDRQREILHLHLKPKHKGFSQ